MLDTGQQKPRPPISGLLKLLFCSGKLIVAKLRKPVNKKRNGGGNLFENVKRLCRERGVTIGEVERACGFGKKSLYAWIGGTPEAIDRVKRIADYFGVTVDELLADDQGSA